MPPLNPPTSSSATTATTTTTSVLPTTTTANSNGTGVRKRRLSSSSSATTTVVTTYPDYSDICTNDNGIDAIAPSGGSRSLLAGQFHRIGEALASGSSSRAIAPIAIIGGTVSVYSSAVQLSDNADLTPLSITYLFLLALNYAVMPRLSKRYIHPETNKRSVALAEEVVKMGLGLGGWILSSYVAATSSNNIGRQNFEETPLTTYDVISTQLRGWSPSSALIAAGLPSALYAVQGALTYAAYQNLDPVTFNGLAQLKTLSSALCCYLVLGKRQSGTQLFALGLLTASAAIFQGSWRDWFGRSGARLGECNENKKIS